MSSTLNYFFELNLPQAQTQEEIASNQRVQKLFDRLKDATSSIDCYCKLFELCMEVLAKQSMEFRQAKQIGTPPTIPPLDPDLEQIVTGCLDEELTVEDEDLVLFEGASFKQGNGQPNVFYKFGVGASVQDPYKNVQVYFKRIEVNRLIEKFKTKYSPTAGQSFPETIGTNDEASVHRSIQDLTAWIKKNILPVHDVLELESKTWKDVVAWVFGSSSSLNQSREAPQYRVDAVRRLCAKLKKQMQRGKAEERKKFIDYLLGSMDLTATPWKDLANLYNELKSSKSEPDQFDLLNGLWTAGLELEDGAGRDAAAQAIGNILKDYTADIFDDARKEVLGELTESLLQEYEVEHLNTLLEFQELPKVISFDRVELLKLAVDELLTSLPLTSKGASPKVGCKAALLALDDYWALSKKIVSYPGMMHPLRDKPYVIVDGDPMEGENDAWRPVCFYDDREQFVFGNIWNAETSLPGMFFFEGGDSPNLAVTKVVDTVTVGNTDYVKDARLTVDFEKCTVDGKEATQDGKPFRAPTGRGGTSKVYFFNVLEQIAKWSCEPRLSYLPYYQTVAGDVDHPIGHLRREMPAGRGRGIGRADSVDKEDWLWIWQGKDDNYPELPTLLGLLEKQEIKLAVGKTIQFPSPQFKATMNGQSYICSSSIEPSLPQSGMAQGQLKVQLEGTDEERHYALVNTPHPDLATALPPGTGQHQKRQVADATILRLFDFLYFRRIDESRNKVLKRVPKNSTRRPGMGDGPTIRAGDPAILGINLPVSFRLNDNVQKLAQTKSGRRDLKNKASVLYKAGGDREDAGSVMAGISNAMNGGFLQNLQTTVTSVKSKLPATGFTAAVIKGAQTAGEDWRALKATDWTELTVNQEWCHLQGHGDGGTERLGNFVSGSYHCNTEQLAMEEGLRETTHREEKGTYLLRTTAYLLKDDGAVMQRGYLNSDKIYLERLQENKKIVATQLGSSPTAPASPEPDPSLLPVAAFIRYKIIKKEGDTYHKVWDYIFEGQSEFFDRNMYQILSMTIRFVLAGMDAFKKWYDDNASSVQDAAANSPMDIDTNT